MAQGEYLETGQASHRQGPMRWKGHETCIFAESYFGLGEQLQMLIDNARKGENLALVS